MLGSLFNSVKKSADSNYSIVVDNLHQLTHKLTEVKIITNKYYFMYFAQLPSNDFKDDYKILSTVSSEIVVESNPGEE